MWLITCLSITLPLIGLGQKSADGFVRKVFEKPADISKAWNATDIHGKEVSLRSVAGQPCVVILFRGHGCYHCLKQLDELTKIESRFRSRGVRLLALSNEETNVMSQAFANRKLPFPVVSDSKSKLAMSLNTGKVKNWHGVLIVDAKGKARSLISGSRPLMDFREVLQQIDKMKLGAKSIESHALRQIVQSTKIPGRKGKRQSKKR